MKGPETKRSKEAIKNCGLTGGESKGAEIGTLGQLLSRQKFTDFRLGGCS